jgi:hypothetical protein
MHLGVVDASILRGVASTPTNVSTIMVAEHISGRYYHFAVATLLA